MLVRPGETVEDVAARMRDPEPEEPHSFGFNKKQPGGILRPNPLLVQVLSLTLRLIAGRFLTLLAHAGAVGGWASSAIVEGEAARGRIRSAEQSQVLMMMMMMMVCGQTCSHSYAEYLLPAVEADAALIPGGPPWVCVCCYAVYFTVC